MDVRGILNTMKKRKAAGTAHELSSPFAYQGLQEYPRPQMARESYYNLNGVWDCSITDGNGSEKYRGPIQVPFSPEARLSGVNVLVEPDDLLTYETKFTLAEGWQDKGERLLLHFGAVDQSARVLVNDEEAGSHVGGYTPFTLDITAAVRTGDNRLVVEVTDTTDTSYHTRGKQTLRPEGMFYHCQSGIWQTVWMEWVKDTYIRRLAITPRIDEDVLAIDIYLDGTISKEGIVAAYRSVCIEMDEDVLESWALQAPGNGDHEKLSLRLRLKDYQLWTPETPVLYHGTVSCGGDKVRTYFAMRSFDVEPDENGFPRLCLNHKPYFLWGVLDQGYWPESLMTPMSDEAMIFDIQSMKDVGFNMLRKHCKIEPMRWYYHCDRLGMVVWQDMVNGGSTYDMRKICHMPTMIRSWTHHSDTTEEAYIMTGRQHPDGHDAWRREFREMVHALYSVPSIGSWVIFNEGWGQFDAKHNWIDAQLLDPTRPIDASSGWFHQEDCSHIYSVHNYFFKLKVEYHGMPFVISEYGGYSLPVPDHVYNDNIYGYRPYEKQEDLQRDFADLQQRIADLIPKGLSAAVYTQVTDVEEEINGVYTYDRKVQKLFPWK